MFGKRGADASDVSKVGIGLTALFVLLVTPTSAAATAACSKVSGKVTMTPVTGAQCTSPQGLCIAGVYSGRFSASWAFTATSVTATVDTPSTGVVVITGDTVLTTKDGDVLRAEDAMLLRNTGVNDMTAVQTVAAGGSGALRLQGVYHPDSGGSAEYTGQVCL